VNQLHIIRILLQQLMRDRFKAIACWAEIIRKDNDGYGCIGRPFDRMSRYVDHLAFYCGN